MAYVSTAKASPHPPAQLAWWVVIPQHVAQNLELLFPKYFSGTYGLSVQFFLIDPFFSNGGCAWNRKIGKKKPVHVNAWILETLPPAGAPLNHSISLLGKKKPLNVPHNPKRSPEDLAQTTIKYIFPFFELQMLWPLCNYSAKKVLKYY